MCEDSAGNRNPTRSRRHLRFAGRPRAAAFAALATVLLAGLGQQSLALGAAAAPTRSPPSRGSGIASTGPYGSNLASAAPRGSQLASLTGSPSQALPRAAVSVHLPADPRAVPRSFLGISTEYWTLPMWARYPELLGRVLGLLRVNGPLVLRIGGDSADRTLWSPARELPEWAFELTPQWLTGASKIVGITRARVILDLNYVTSTPRIAASWASRASANLPKGSILGFEIGNEPDIYSHRFWLRVTAAGLHGTGRNALPVALSPSGYADSFLSYSRALTQVAPGIPLLGPALADPNSHLGWVSSLLASPHPGLAAITVHRYPYSACALPSWRKYPTIARVLSENASAGLAASLRPVLALASRAGLPVRLTELNSVTCGGLKGVSKTFATALWAPDALFELLRAGVMSADVHIRAEAINMAFSLTRHGLVANPLFYGLLTFVRTIGPDAKLLAVNLHARPALHLKAWAVALRGGVLHVLVINKGARSTAVSLALPTHAPATVQRLLAPSVRSTSGVTLAGQRLGPDGRWTGPPVLESLPRQGRAYKLTVRGYSAALVTVKLARSGGARQ